MPKLSYLIAAICYFIIQPTWAMITVPMTLITAKSESATQIGTITATDTRYGLLIEPNLTNLPPGLHGTHIHTNPSCAQSGQAAGGHFDPRKTNKHLGPYNGLGHLGDLPALYTDTYGNTTLPVLAPRLREKALIGRSIIIHAGGDNYADTPKALGGGGLRIACGLTQS